MVKRTLQLSVLVAVIAVVCAGLAYRSWVAENTGGLERGSEVVSTALGPIEIARTNESGPTVLLVHGTPGGYDQTITLADAFGSAGYPVIAISRPGYLRTPLSIGRTPAQQADSYAALLDSLDLERVALVGISGGGPSALEFAIRHPERCWALVDFMGVSRAPEEDEMAPARQLERGALARFASSNFGGWVLGIALRANPAAVVRSLVRDEDNVTRILSDPDALARFIALAESGLRLPELRNEGTRNDMDQFLTLAPLEFDAIRVPTLVLHGTADINVPLAMAKLVAKNVRGAELVTFAGADHFMGITHPDEVFSPLFAFLDRNRPR